MTQEADRKFVEQGCYAVCALSALALAVVLIGAALHFLFGVCLP